MSEERRASCGCVFDAAWRPIWTCDVLGAIVGVDNATQHIARAAAEIARAEQAAPRTQPAPIHRDDAPDITELVIERLKARREQGIATYGTTLQPFNGRDALEDALAEALDLAQYLTQAIEERRAEQSVPMGAVSEDEMVKGEVGAVTDSALPGDEMTLSAEGEHE